jgi:hypothetical protein
MARIAHLSLSVILHWEVKMHSLSTNPWSFCLRHSFPIVHDPWKFPGFSTVWIGMTSELRVELGLPDFLRFASIHFWFLPLFIWFYRFAIFRKHFSFSFPAVTIRSLSSRVKEDWEWN